MNSIRIAAALAALAALAVPGSARADEIIYTTNQPEQHFDPSLTMSAFAESIAEATGGAQTVAIHPGGTLASAASALEAIGDGVVDAGNVIFPYTPSLLPAVTLLTELPGTIPQVSAAAMTETLLLGCPECEANTEALGVKVLGVNTTEPFTFMCAKAPAATLDELKGRKVRGVGGIGRIVAEIGAVPVNLAFPEVYQGLQRGQIDCTVFGAASLATLQIWEVADFVTTDLSLGTFNGYSNLVVNRERWDGFTPEQKRAWLDASADMVADNARNGLNVAREALETSFSEKGVEPAPADDALREAVGGATALVTDFAIASAKDRGVVDPQAIADAYLKNAAKWTGIYEEIGADGEWTDAQWETFGERLKTEIYDKVAAE